MGDFRRTGRVELALARGSLGLIAVCFLLPFFTFTLSSCGETDSSRTLQVTGIDLVRNQHHPIENRSGHGATVGRDRDVLASARRGQEPAVAVAVFVLLALVAAVMPRRFRARVAVVTGMCVLWSLFVLAGSVDSGYIDVGYDSGFVLAVLLAVGAVAAAAVAAFRECPPAVTPELAPPAGFWIRLAAWTVDVLLLVSVGVPVVVAASVLGVSGAVFWMLIAIVLVYRVATESSAARATIGGRAVGLQVAGVGGERLSIRRAALRAICEICCLFFLFGIGHALAGLTTGKRALHDVLSGSSVTRRRRPSQPVVVDAPLPLPTVRA